MQRSNPNLASRAAWLVLVLAAAAAIAQETAPAPGPGIAGKWNDETPGLGRSTWKFIPLPNGNYHAQQLTGSQAVGTASLTENRLRIDWTIQTFAAGHIEYELDGTGTAGKGKSVITKGDRLGSYDCSIKLVEPGLVPASEAPLGKPLSIWLCTNTTAIGKSYTLLRLYPDGQARSDYAGAWDRGTWRSQGGEIWIDWGLAEKHGDHYMMKLAVSGDGRALSLSPGQKDGNYYVRKLEAIKIDASAATAAAGGGKPPARDPASGRPAPFLVPRANEKVLGTFGEMKLTPPPLRLPPVGAANRPDAQGSLRGEILLAGGPLRRPFALLAVQNTSPRIEKLAARHLPGRDPCERGSLLVDLGVTTPDARVYAQVYVGGYIKEVSRTRRAPAYRTLRWTPKGKEAVFDVPRVLPAAVRVELYSGENNTLLDRREATFDLPWPDLDFVGGIYGSESDNTISRVAALIRVDGSLPVPPDPRKRGAAIDVVIPHASAVRTLSDPNASEARRSNALLDHYAYRFNKLVDAVPAEVSSDRVQKMSDPGWEFGTSSVHAFCGGDRDERNNRRYFRQPGNGWDESTLYKLGF